MVGPNLVFSQARAQLMRDTFDQTARIDEDQRGSLGVDLTDNSIIDLRPELVAGDGSECLFRQVYSQIEIALVTDIHDSTLGRSIIFDAIVADQ